MSFLDVFGGSKLLGVYSILTIRICGLVAAILVPPHCAHAQSKLDLSLGDQGMVTAKVTLEPAPASEAQNDDGPVSSVALKTLVLPFELDPTYRVSKRDDMEVSVLLNGDDYCMLTVLSPRLDTESTIQIENAFDLVGKVAENRVKLSADTSYLYLKQHRAILRLPTVSKYDITISLPKKYEKDQLSFEPPQDRWVEQDPGRTYTLPSNIASQTPSEVWIAFPNPFEGPLYVGQIAVSLAVGVVLFLSVDCNAVAYG